MGTCAFMLLSGAVFALYISRPQSGLGHDVLDLLEYPIGENSPLRYNVHLALGKIFSVCPCTSGLSADQYRRASFHRPQPTVTP